MDPKPVSRQRAAFLGALTVGIVAFIVIAVLLSKSPHVKTAGPDRSSSPTAASPSQVATTRATGLHQGTYYGQTIRFVVPSGIENLTPTQGYSLGDEVSFTFGADGSGSLMTRPADATMSQAELVKNYPGKKKPIKIAGAEGFLLDQETGAVASVTAIAHRGPFLLTIQMTHTGGPRRLDSLVTDLASAIRLRRSSEAGS